MYQVIERRVREALSEFIRAKYGERVNVTTARPPQIEMGEIASPVCFELAKKLKRAPRQIAQEIAAEIGKIEGVERIEVAGGGYLNAFLDRGAFLADTSRGSTGSAHLPGSLGSGGARRSTGSAHLPGSLGSGGVHGSTGSANLPGSRVWYRENKVIVEHTAINPNKAAHIGHLRNAVIGDTFVRLLRAMGRRVEVQNYIDNTGVQVADVILGFVHLQKFSLADVQALVAKSAAKDGPRFDFYCWDLYARVTQFLADDKARLALRAQMLKEIEEGHSAVAEMADFVSTTILRTHLETMDRLGIDYDLLSRESDVLGMKFWDAAFAMLRERGAIRLATSGKQAGCWIMPRGDAAENPDLEPAEEGVADAKIIVRSNGTVTYVGKDIAYHLWKFGLLDRDFRYAKFHEHPDGHEAWVTTMDGHSGGDGVPKFGNAKEVFNVIDSRQKYPQQVVRDGLRALGFTEQAEHLTHIAYDVVGLTPRCAIELGYTVTDEDAKRPYIEMSGRKGQGVKADDLLDQMEKHALAEVDARHRDFADIERSQIAHVIAMGALRYFLLKYTRGTIIAFDFKDALSFEGETGPYAQYAVVRARNIFRKMQEQDAGFSVGTLGKAAETKAATNLLKAPEGNDLWELLLLAGSLDARAEAAVSAQEPAFVAKYGFELAQAFNVFYHKHHILSEGDATKRNFLLLLTAIVERQLVSALNLLGIEAPEKM